MPGPKPISSCLVLLLLWLTGLSVRAAEPVRPPQPLPERPARPRAAEPGPPPARLVKVEQGSITVRPARSTAAAGKPAKAADPAGPADANGPPPAKPAENVADNDQTFAVGKERTRVTFGVVTAERLTDLGRRARMMRWEPAELDDLEVGQFVHVTSRDGVATEVQVVPDPDAPLPGPDKVVKVDEKSLTIAPPAKAAAANPAGAAAEKDRTFTIDKARTRVEFGIVMNERLTDTGQRLRTVRIERGELADLEAGQFVHVTARRGVATSIQIVPDPDAPLPGPATVVKVDEKSLTVAPPAAARPVNGGAAAAPQPGAAPVAPAQRTYVLDPAKTRVTVTSINAERVTANGQIVRSMRMNNGTLADLKAGQFVEVRARGDVAIDVRVVPEPAPPPPPRPARRPGRGENAPRPDAKP